MFLARRCAVTIRIFARKNTTVGIWKTSTIPASIFTCRSNASATLDRNSSSALLKVSKNAIMLRNTMQWLKSQPSATPLDDINTNGITKRFSLA
jgi:hypothetical protein